MKKIGLFIVPLISISLLASCGPKAKTYHVKFTSGNKLVSEKDYKENEVIIAPNNPAPYEQDHKTYTFEAWYDGDIKFVEGTKATKDVEYVAQFNGVDTKYTVTFMNEGQEYKKITDAKYGDEIIAPETNPTKDTDKKYEYTFDKWIYKDTGKDFVTGDKVEGNTIIVADYNKKAIKYDVTFKKGTEIVDTKEFNADNLSVTAPTFSPTAHYTGIWSATGEHASSGKKADSGATITFTEDELDNWEFNYQENPISYDVEFVDKSGSKIVRQITCKALTITAPTHTTTTHYDGVWKEGTREVKSGESITFTESELTKHTFMWTETAYPYTVKFNDGSGQVGEDYVIKVGSLTITTPAHTSSATYKDGCWKDGDIVINPSTEFTFREEQLADHTFTWTETDHEYEVTFKYVDEVESKDTISCSKLSLTAPATKETAKTEHRYVWKSGDIIIESEGTKTFTTGELKDYVFTETEVENVYSITYELGDEAAVNPTTNLKSYKASDAVTLANPTLDGFTFKGWYLNDSEHDKFEYQDGWTPGQMTGNITLYADWHVNGKTLDDYSWPQISTISIDGEASKYFDVGDTKKVYLNHQSNDIYQTVRIIGFNEDYENITKNEDGEWIKSNPIGITFEFVDLISDASGYSLATYWNDAYHEDASNYHYDISSVRKALNSESDDDCDWFQYFGTEEDAEDTGKNRHFTTDTNYAGKSVLKMLPNELATVLKKASKFVNVCQPEWHETTITDKLFLLSAKENGRKNSGEINTTTYTYYKNDNAKLRQKHQIKWYDGARTTILAGNDLDGMYEDDAKYSYAGFNATNDNNYSGFSWLRSPETTDNTVKCMNPYGYFDSSHIACKDAIPVAPAFCI